MIHATAERNHETASANPLLARGKFPRQSLLSPQKAPHGNRPLSQTGLLAHPGNAAVPPIQRRAVSGAPSPALAASQNAANLATSGPSHALPYQTAIQSSFGRHDLSGVKAYTGPAAASGARSMQADAFTRGSHVAFAANPSLHLAAHEAAHVIQQRSGLTLADGVGQKGDRHEQHAEQVAQRVVHGQSSESLLDSYASSGNPRSQNSDSIQRFESEEHQHLGDVATGSRKYSFSDPAVPNDKFDLTHGDILALSGDVFPADELFTLAAKAGDHGKMIGTRDEVICALQLPAIWEMRAGATGPGPYSGKNDPRFEKGGIWDGWKFDAVEGKVLERYQKLAAENASHFAAPKGRNAKGAIASPETSASGNYRQMHETALSKAYALGLSGGNIDAAMAREAAGQHFLTDGFSAGHLRTPITLIRDYWHKRYPLFWYNLRHKIALDTAIELTKGKVVTAHYGYDEILAQVEAKAPHLPAITLGDLLAKVFHDVDNEQGVNIKGGGKVFGDAHMDTATENLAVAAIQSGIKDIEEAYNLGVQTQAPMKDPDLFAKIRPLNGGTKEKYSAELQMPEPDKGEPAQNWKAADIGTLWDKPLLGNKGDTVGMGIEKTVKTGAIAQTLDGLKDMFPVDYPPPGFFTPNAVVGYIHPQAAYVNGFVDNLKKDPRAGVQDIVAWAPHGMSTGRAPREVVQDLVAKEAAGDKAENLSLMTMAQRAAILKPLIDDAKPGLVLDPQGNADDQAMIFKMFENLGPAGRLQLFKRVEGRDWNGDFNTTYGFRDELFIVFEKTPASLARMKKLLNGH